MPKPKVSKGAAAAPSTSDPRFSNFTTDPRFRLPSKKQTRTKVDKRFSRMLTDDSFSNTAKVDRYGRKLSSSASGKKKALERLYMKEEEDEDEDEEEDEGKDEEEHDGEDEDIEVEDDEVVEKELRRAERGYDPARGGGFSSSSEEDSDDEDSDGGVEIEEEVGEGGEMRIQDTGIEMGEVSSRIAVVNMDWDNIRAIDLMAVFSSFAEPGKIHKISVYPSEFGRERMEREEMEGPPKEIFTKNNDDASEEDSEDNSEDEDEDEKIKKDLLKEDDGKDFDGAALRQYQLERLRYYYAVIVCSDEKTAKNIYDNTDGSEYLGSANVFDLRFIPDGTEFDEKARDECDKVTTDYRPTEFVTEALQHSKVKLTWDQNPDDAVRKDALNRAFSGSRAEIGENDLRAYLGSDSESDTEEEKAEAEPTDEPKLTKKELARQKMRAALGLSDEPTSKPKKGGPVGDMEVTFTAGLTANEKGSVFENEPIKDETTAERYIRKEKERKARRKEKAKAVREGRDPEAEPEMEEAETADGDLGFDDPFFAEDKDVKDKAAKTLRKAERQKKREAKQKEAEEKASNRAELELLMADNSAETAAHLDHFDMNEIARTEKQKRKKQRSKKSSKEGEPESKRGGLQENFEIDVGDERFGKVFEDHEFAIDPSNPRFKGTEGMKKLLEEGRRKRGIDKMEDAAVERPSKKKRDDSTTDAGKDDLSGLVEKIKKKSKRV